MGALSMPLMVQAYGYKTGELTWLEVFGWTLWLVSIAFEHIADKQKKAVCDVEPAIQSILESGWYRTLLYSLHFHLYLHSVKPLKNHSL
jgi:steroid 5-alpha reductase family enzyme